MYFITFSLSNSLIKQAGLVVTLKTCILEVLGSNIGWGSCYPQVFCGFPQSLQTNGWTVPQKVHDHFHPNIF
jgi:hypothetical protein